MKKEIEFLMKGKIMPKTSAETMFVCDSCKKKLTEKTVVKKPLGNSFEIHTPGCKVWQKDGKQWGLFCPHCDTPHFFGFDRAV